MSEKLYRLYCDACNWKLITSGTDEASKKLVEIKTSPIPAGYPKVDLETKKVVIPPAKKQLKKFKCPQCGKGVRPVQIEDVQSKIDENKLIQKRVEERNEEDWSVGRKESAERWSLPRFPSPGISQDT